MAGPACACTFRWIAGKKRSGGDAFTEEAAQPQDGGSTGCDCSCRNITQSPYDTLLKNGEPIRDLLKATEKYVRNLQADGKVDRKLMRILGEKLQELTGLSDFAFLADLPPSGSKAVVLRALCPLRDLTLGDGDATISGAFAASLQRVLEPLGFELVLSNIAMVCWRKGKEGKELTGAAAGCVDPAGIVLDLLAVVKELHMYGLLAAGVVVSGVLVSSNAAVASFGYDPAVVKHGARYTPTTGLFYGIPIVFLSHLKYVAPGPVFLQFVADRCGVNKDHPLAVTSACIELWAKGCVIVTGGDEESDDAVRSIYEQLCNDPHSPATGREWEDRHASDMSPAEMQRLKAIRSERARQNGRLAAGTRTRRLGHARKHLRTCSVVR